MEKSLLFKFKPEYIFLFLGLLFGLTFLIITPIFQVPDENMHLLRACEVSNFVLHNNKDGDITKDFFPNKNLVKENCSNFQEFKNIPHYTELFEFKDLNYTHNNTGYSFLLYLPSAAGIKITSLLTSNTYIQFYAGRIFNFISWLIITFFAIKIVPRFKWAFLICALFPMTVYEGMSLSADSINLGFAFFYIAYTFYLVYGENKTINRKELCFYIFLSLLSALTKGLFLLTFLSLMIPKEKFKNKFIIVPAIILSVIALQSILTSNSYILTANDVSPEERKILMFSSHVYAVKLFINTLIHKTAFYIQSSIFRLGWLEIEPADASIFSLTFCYLLAIILENNRSKLTERITAFCIISTFVLLTLFLYYFTFSPLENNIIIGAQGRYFIPLWLILAAVIQQNRIVFTKKQDKILKFLILLTIIVNLVYASILIIKG